ncbi:MAG TPA: hypothetical protein VG078_05155 [Acidimicrobiales bacterium]|nr:hypothetical protein [Acidimicrobiales bacterium]
MRRLVGLAMVVLVALGTGAVGACGNSSGEAGDGDAPPVEETTFVPGPGQLFVTGDVTRLVAEDALLKEPFNAPFTLTAVERGAGNATIANALVAGKRSTISWATGTPLPITGSGGLELGPLRMEVDARGGLALNLDGAARAFRPGSYRANAPVAVGSAGIAASRDGVDFTADAQTTLTTRGVVVRRDPARVELEGPGKLSIAGRLQVQTPEGTRPAATVTFGPGPFRITLQPRGDRVTIESLLQGQFTAA